MLTATGSIPADVSPVMTTPDGSGGVVSEPTRRLAVVLFNLGGPDGPADVRPFLRNLFSDPAIIRAPPPLRFVLARLIARVRERSATANYALMGGGSPLLGETLKQASALAHELAERRTVGAVEVFVAMRYSSPGAREAAKAVEAFDPEDIVLLPLYPQYSTTTSASSLAQWATIYRGGGAARTVCCWYDAGGLIEAHTSAITAAWRAAGAPKVRLLFSAHGLPRAIDADGDPYRWQVERTCAAVAARLGDSWDWQVCFQSRVGPMKWLEPSTPDAIRRAGEEGLGVLVDPIAFVSEHVETLVELDRDYAELARAVGVPLYLRAAALGVAEPFIAGLADVVEGALRRPVGVDGHRRPCPAGFGRCARIGKEAPACFSTS